jgi:hypothetical protein
MAHCDEGWKKVRQLLLRWAVETAATFASPACWRAALRRLQMNLRRQARQLVGDASVGAVSTAYEMARRVTEVNLH